MIEELEQELQDQKSFYVSLFCADSPNSENSKELENEISEFLNDDKKTGLLLLGDSGAGKTLFIKQLALNLLKKKHEYLPVYAYLPIIKEFRNGLVQQALSIYGIQDSEQLKFRKIVFLLDAYDEIGEFVSIINTNKLTTKFPQAKYIITCRSNYALKTDNYKQFFCPYLGEKAQISQLHELYIKPFTNSQIQDYVKLILKKQTEEQEINSSGGKGENSLETRWQSNEEVMTFITSIPGLLEILNNPFLLQICVADAEILKRIKGSNKRRILKSNLYEVFIKNWYKKNKEKLIIQGQKMEMIEEVENIFDQISTLAAYKLLNKENIPIRYKEGDEE